METTNFVKRRFEKLFLLTIMFFSSVIAFAQDATKSADVDITTSETTTTTTTEEWFTNPLYWVIGALVLIVVIALIARGNNRTD
ncbi:MAG: hypothetical protein K0M63_03340 [Weeksellaceae bacterium]|jgi:hypothetical protein|nr:hypothetical protein [Weeksellaceae bacterium]